MKLKVIGATFFKARPIQSIELGETAKKFVNTGEFEISDFKFIENSEHLRVFFKGVDFEGASGWYAYQPHVEIYDDNDRQIYPIPSQFSIKLPYKSQLDNWNNPNGSCNVTSIAMCLEYFGVTSKNSDQQLEDELYEYALRNGYSRHNPYDLAQIVEDYGLKNTFKIEASIEEVKSWLARGNPAVIHGYFTRFGHIIAVMGYDEHGLKVHDPYGEWFVSGYRTDLSGENLHYSYNLIRQACMHDDDFWVHFISD